MSVAERSNRRLSEPDVSDRSAGASSPNPRRLVPGDGLGGGFQRQRDLPAIAERDFVAAQGFSIDRMEADQVFEAL